MGNKFESIKNDTYVIENISPSKKKIHVNTLRFSWYGTDGVMPSPYHNYGGLVFYDRGSFKWKRTIKPGYCMVMCVDDMKFADNEGENQPHRPMCRNIFGMSIQELQNDHNAIMSGFSLQKNKLFVNSGAFNTHELGGHNFNGYKDNSKSMNELESQLIVGTFSLFIKKGWPVHDPTTSVTVKEALEEGKKFTRKKIIRPSGRASYYYTGIYG